MIKIENISKQYARSTKKAINDVSMVINTGEAFGILGPNGAGKTTLMSIITTLSLPSKGKVYLDGEEIGRSRVDLKKKFAFVTQHISVRKDMTVNEVLELSGRLYGMPCKLIKEKSRSLLEFTGLSDKQKSIARGLSGGQQRKLMIARALLSNPEILVLDEPTVGLDPHARRKMWDLLIDLKLKGMTLLLTTHYIEEAENVCDRVAFIKDGRVSGIDAPYNMIKTLGSYAADVFEDNKRRTYFFSDAESANDFVLLSRKKARLRETTLEDVFLDKMGKDLNDYNG